MPTQLAWTISFVDIDRRFWSSDGDLTYAGNTYQGGRGLSIEHTAAELGAPVRRAVVSLALQDLNDIFLNDLGPVQVEIEYIYSSDRGITWLATGERFIGLTSTATFVDGAYSVEIETYTGWIDQGPQLKWSHETQVGLDPGGDFFMEMTRTLEGRTTLESNWPQ